MYDASQKQVQTLKEENQKLQNMLAGRGGYENAAAAAADPTQTSNSRLSLRPLSRTSSHNSSSKPGGSFHFGAASNNVSENQRHKTRPTAVPQRSMSAAPMAIPQHPRYQNPQTPVVTPAYRMSRPLSSQSNHRLRQNAAFTNTRQRPYPY